MAWVTSGSSISSIDYTYPDGLPSGKNYEKILYSFKYQCDNDSCLYVKKQKPDSENIVNYDVYCVKRETGQYSEGVRNGTRTERYHDYDPIISNYENQPFNRSSVFKIGTNTSTLDNKRVIRNYSGVTSIPVFDNEEEISKYIQSGDDSGKILF